MFPGFRLAINKFNKDEKKNHGIIYSSLSTPADKNPIQMFVLLKQQQKGELQPGGWQPQERRMCLKSEGQRGWQGGADRPGFVPIEQKHSN